MKDNLFCSLEISKALMKQNFRLDFPLFFSEAREENGITKHRDVISYLRTGRNVNAVYYPAYTLGELLEILPFKIEVMESIYSLEIFRNETGMGFTYTIDDKKCFDERRYFTENFKDSVITIFWDKNPCDACAKLIIFLLKNNLLSNEKK